MRSYRAIHDLTYGPCQMFIGDLCPNQHWLFVQLIEPSVHRFVFIGIVQEGSEEARA
jgi:hypothetical protein